MNDELKMMSDLTITLFLADNFVIIEVRRYVQFVNLNAILSFSSFFMGNSETLQNSSTLSESFTYFIHVECT